MDMVQLLHFPHGMTDTISFETFLSFRFWYLKIRKTVQILKSIKFHKCTNFITCTFNVTHLEIANIIYVASDGLPHRARRFIFNSGWDSTKKVLKGNLKI